MRGPTKPTPVIRLAVIATHPIQYYAPWLRVIASTPGIELKVFYLWDFGVTARRDPSFQRDIQWDVPLLDGYSYAFVPNVSRRPGTDHFFGLRNPALTREVREFSPSAVLLLAYNFEAIIRFVARWRGPTPLLFRGDSHRLVTIPGLRQALRDVLIGQLFRRFAACLYVGQANRRYFLEHGVDQSRLFFTPHAVDNSRFVSEASVAHAEAKAWRATLGIPSDHRVVLFAGKLDPVKRPMDLLHAFREAGMPRASLLFVGSGQLETQLRTEASGLDHVHFAPFQNQSVMPRTYASCDLFVLPSFSETWGLSVNEAMCLGRPVIVSNHVGCGEDLVIPNETGLIFPAGNVPELARALRRALADDEQMHRWGEAGKRRVEAYSYERATAGLMEALTATTGASLPQRRRLQPVPQPTAMSTPFDG
jgi:glycosyltransferase involved in cell wall biosynthesis